MSDIIFLRVSLIPSNCKGIKRLAKGVTIRSEKVPIIIIYDYPIIINYRKSCS